jgi:hypothetical protein
MGPLSSCHQRGFSPAADGSGYGDSQPYTMQRKSLNWRSPLCCSPQSSGNLMEGGREEDCRRQRQSRIPGEHGLLSQLSRDHMSSQRQRKQAQSPPGSAPGLHICNGCHLGLFMGFLTVGAVVSLTFLPTLLSSCWVVILGCCLLEACSFLKGIGAAGGGEGRQEAWKERTLWSG